MVTRTTSSIARTVVCAIALVSIGVSLPSAPTAATESEGKALPAAPAENAAPPAGTKAAATPVLNPGSATCERYVAVLAGREKDAALAKEPEVRRLAARARDLVTCGAVRADSDDACKVLENEDAEQCRRTRAMFHELRAYPTGRSYMFDDAKYQECKKAEGMAPVCEALRKALRSGDPGQCVIKADFEAMCRDAMRSGTATEVSDCATEAPQIKNMLEGECRAMVTLDESACDIPGPRRAEMAKQCRDDITARKSYGKGLKDLAASGSETEKEFAKAALGDAEACKSLTKSALDVCLAKSAPPPAPVEAPAAAGGAGSAAPEAGSPDAAQ